MSLRIWQCSEALRCLLLTSSVLQINVVAITFCWTGLGLDVFFNLTWFDICYKKLASYATSIFVTTQNSIFHQDIAIIVCLFLLDRLQTQRRRLFSSGIGMVLGLTLMRRLICRRENVTSLFPRYSITYWLEMTASAWCAIDLPGRSLNQLLWFLFYTILRTGIFSTLQLASV